MPMNRSEERVLKELLDRAADGLNAYIDTGSSHADQCHVSDLSREESGPYLNAWVEVPLAQAVELLDRLMSRSESGR